MTDRLNTDKAIVNKCLALLEETVEETINVLYSSIDNFLFQDINFSIVSSNMPKWILDEGISPEGVLTKDAYEICRRKVTHPIFGLYMYYYELWTIVAAIPDRLQAVRMFLTQFYDNIPCIAKFTNSIRRAQDNVVNLKHHCMYCSIVSLFHMHLCLIYYPKWQEKNMSLINMTLHHTKR